MSASLPFGTKPSSSAPQPHTRWPLAVVFGVLGSLLIGLVVLAFLWPAKTATAQNLPVSIAGPSASVSAFEKAIDAASPDTFDFVAADDRAQAVRQIKDRTSYGAIVLAAAPAAPEVLTAPAGSAVATQLLTGVATQLQAQLAQQVAAAGGDASAVKVTVTAVVPLASSDPTGTGLTAASFPLVLGGMLGGVLVSLLVVGVIRRLVAVLGLAIASGLVITLILQTWFDYLQGDYWLNALGIGAAILATSTFIVGCTSLLGGRGIAVGAVLTILVGNPLSAAATPWQFLATPWGAIGQFLVPGAGNTLIRSLSYFPDANTTPQWLVLGGWIVLGVVLALIGHSRNRAEMRLPQGTLDASGPEAASA